MVYYNKKRGQFQIAKSNKNYGKNINNKVSGGGHASNLSEMSYKIRRVGGGVRRVRTNPL